MLSSLLLSDLRRWWETRREDLLEDYLSFLRFPSVSSEPTFKEDVRRCALWLTAQLERIGFQTELWEKGGHPVVFASSLCAGPDCPTILLYNHYDVQPVDPLEEWLSPPFEPTIREGQAFARGAQDNKGQCFYVLAALKALKELRPDLPLNIKWCIEGEEECGSRSLFRLLPEKKEALKADYLAIVDLGIPDKDIPAITLGIRGIVTMDVEAQGSLADLHSGSHGGMAYNPLHALVEALNKLRDSNGRIAVPGFYDQVEEISEEEKNSLFLSFDEDKYQTTFGISATGGEKNYSPLERAWLRPTIEINGLHGGYGGVGFKTVIPAKAFAKVSCRLAPQQDPQEIGRLVADFLEKQAPKGISIRAHIHEGGGKASRASSSSCVAQAFAQAYAQTFGSPCRFIFEGGSIPIAAELSATTESELILLGLGLAEDLIHAPNEHFGLDRLEKGCLIIAQALEILSSKNKKNR